MGTQRHIQLRVMLSIEVSDPVGFPSPVVVPRHWRYAVAVLKSGKDEQNQENGSFDEGLFGHTGKPAHLYCRCMDKHARVISALGSSGPLDVAKEFTSKSWPSSLQCGPSEHSR